MKEMSSRTARARAGDTGSNVALAGAGAGDGVELGVGMVQLWGPAVEHA